MGSRRRERRRRNARLLVCRWGSLYRRYHHGPRPLPLTYIAARSDPGAGWNPARERLGFPPWRRQRSPGWLIASAILHAVLLLAFLLTPPRRAPSGKPAGSPSYQLVFEAPPRSKPAAAPHRARRPRPGQTVAAPTAPPVEHATTPGAPAHRPAPKPVVMPPRPAVPPTPKPKVTAPSHPAPPKPMPKPLPPSPPASVNLEAGGDVPLPPPVPIPQALPMPPPPRIQRAVRRPSNPFAGAVVLGGPLALRQPVGRPMREGGAPRRGVDLSLGPVLRAERPSAGRYAAADAAHAAGDWKSLFRDWFEQRKYYPAAAGERGEEGAATVEITVDRYGRVQHAHLVTTSGSSRLDDALLGILRDAQVPPLLRGMKAPFHFLVTLDYRLEH